LRDQTIGVLGATSVVFWTSQSFIFSPHTGSCSHVRRKISKIIEQSPESSVPGAHPTSVVTILTSLFRCSSIEPRMDSSLCKW
jgi:hypothetical protein